MLYIWCTYENTLKYVVTKIKIFLYSLGPTFYNKSHEYIMMHMYLSSYKSQLDRIVETSNFIPFSWAPNVVLASRKSRLLGII